MKTYAEQMQRIANDYVASGEQWPTSARAIAAWAIQNGRWHAQHSTLISQCADELAKAMREEYITDAQGRRVRAKHAARLLNDGEQQSIWADIRSASRSHMEAAFKQRREQIVGDCRQLKVDVDSYNENRSPSEPIQMVFDFRRDLEELEFVK